MKLKQVNPEKLYHPLLEGIRTRMQAGDWSEIKKSVATLGVQVPIIARKHDDSKLEIVDGLRRTAAALVAKLETVPVLEISEEDAVTPKDALLPIQGLTLISNAVRERNPIAEYRAIQNLIDQGMSQKQIAKQLGISPSTVSHRLRLERVDPELLAEAEAGRIPYTVLRHLPKYGKEVQKQVLEKIRNGEKVRVRDLDELNSADEVDPVFPLEGLATAIDNLMAPPSPEARVRKALEELRSALLVLDLGPQARDTAELLDQLERLIQEHTLQETNPEASLQPR